MSDWMTAWPIAGEAAGEAVYGLLLKATLVLAAGLGAAFVLRSRPAAVRHAVLVGTFAAAIALPALSLLLPGWSVPVFDREPEHAMGSFGSAGAAAPAAAMDAASVVPMAVPKPSPAGGHDQIPFPPAESRGPWLPVLLAVWSAGTLAILLRFGWDLARMRSLVREAVHDPSGLHARLAARIADRLGVRRPVRVLFSDRVSVPVTWGVLAPVVVLPIEAWEWGPERSRLVILHELAHVRRLDCLTSALAEAAAALWWFHPLQWICRRRFRVEQERACDDIVLIDGVRPSDYASLLVEVARGFSAMERSSVARAAIAMARPSTLSDRVESILAAGSRSLRLGRRAAALVALAVLAVLLPVAVVHLWGETVEVRRAAALIEDLASDDGAVREAAAWGLGSLRSERAVGPLIERLVDPDPRVRGVAARALGRIGDPRAFAPLARALADPDPHVRELAVLGLETIPDDRTLDALVGALDDPEMGVRSVAVSALAHMGGPRAVLALASAAERDPDPHTRIMALSALGKRGHEGHIAVPRLIGLLRDGEGSVRSGAARALGEIGDPRAAPALVERLSNEPEAEVRDAIVVALTAFPDDPRAIDGLLLALRDREWEIRVSAAMALGRAGERRAVPELLEALRDPVHQVRLQSAWALDEIEGRGR
ncbi:MAG: M56 family metallopeptidase [Gemmatimonadota bacterium]